MSLRIQVIEDVVRLLRILAQLNPPGEPNFITLHEAATHNAAAAIGPNAINIEIKKEQIFYYNSLLILLNASLLEKNAGSLPTIHELAAAAYRILKTDSNSSRTLHNDPSQDKEIIKIIQTYGCLLANLYMYHEDKLLSLHTIFTAHRFESFKLFYTLKFLPKIKDFSTDFGTHPNILKAMSSENLLYHCEKIILNIRDEHLEESIPEKRTIQMVEVIKNGCRHYLDSLESQKENDNVKEKYQYIEAIYQITNSRTDSYSDAITKIAEIEEKLKLQPQDQNALRQHRHNHNNIWFVKSLTPSKVTEWNREQALGTEFISQVQATTNVEFCQSWLRSADPNGIVLIRGIRCLVNPQIQHHESKTMNELSKAVTVVNRQ